MVDPERSIRVGTESREAAIRALGGHLSTGHRRSAAAALAFCGVGVIWCLVDGVLILVQGGTDGEGRQLRS